MYTSFFYHFSTVQRYRSNACRDAFTRRIDPRINCHWFRTVVTWLRCNESLRSHLVFRDVVESVTVCRVKFTRKLHQEYSKVISRLAAIAKLSFFFLQLKRDLFTCYCRLRSFDNKYTCIPTRSYTRNGKWEYTKMTVLLNTCNLNFKRLINFNFILIIIIYYLRLFLVIIIIISNFITF